MCRDGEEADREIASSLFNLCIFDVMLPRKDGFALAQTVREKNQSVPILFLTAKAMTEDKLQGFRSGGDDYITKPFSLEELFFRVEVFLKRDRIAVPYESDGIVLGSYEFEFSKLLLRQGQSERALTQKEANVLRLLYEHRDRVLKREEILRAVWGDDDYFMGRSLDVFISKLRKYLRDDPSVQIINHHGVGFKIRITC